jgi:hypothetical protein
MGCNSSTCNPWFHIRAGNSTYTAVSSEMVSQHDVPSIICQQILLIVSNEVNSFLSVRTGNSKGIFPGAAD